MVDLSMTIDEIAKVCGVNPPMVRRWIEHGQLAAVPEDRHRVRIRGSELETMVVACARSRAQEARKRGRPAAGLEGHPHRAQAPSREASSAEAPVLIARTDGPPPSIADGGDLTLIERGLFRPGGRWRWTMFLVWPVLSLVAILASIEFGPLLH